MENIKSYRLVKENEFLSINLVGKCVSCPKEFCNDILPRLKDSAIHLIINCEHLESISSDWIRALMKVQLEVKKHEKSMRFINVGKKVQQAYKEQGVDSAFVICKSLNDALVSLGLSKENILDIRFINPFLSATIHVLKVQASVIATPGKIFTKRSNESLHGKVSGVMGIMSDTFNGSVAISFPEPTFLKVMSSLLGEPFLEINQDILNSAGELNNMIFGHAKVVLNENGYGIKTALPSVVSGKEHSLSLSTKAPIVVIPFGSESGEFYVEIFRSA